MSAPTSASTSTQTPTPSPTQTSETTPAPVQLTEEQIQELQQEINGYMEEVANITSLITSCDGNQLKQLHRTLQTVDARWQVFNAMEQSDIASTPALMDLLAQYKQVYLAAEDSLTAGLAKCNAQTTFNSDVAFINKCAITYQGLLRKAQQYSLVAQTAVQLSDVKAKEQILMGQVTAKYNEAVTAAGVNPVLKDQLEILEQKYIAIQQTSGQIQACAYKPVIQRIKDYLMSFAAVAIILMFFTMVSARISAIRNARKMARKLGNKSGRLQDDIPTI